jgi:hypothetical protein
MRPVNQRPCKSFCGCSYPFRTYNLAGFQLRLFKGALSTYYRTTTRKPSAVHYHPHERRTVHSPVRGCDGRKNPRLEEGRSLALPVLGLVPLLFSIVMGEVAKDVTPQSGLPTYYSAAAITRKGGGGERKGYVMSMSALKLVILMKFSDRKPVDPPPIIQLKISHESDPVQNYLQSTVPPLGPTRALLANHRLF